MPSNRGTFPHNAPCSLTYWHNKILATTLWCSRCVRLCWYKAFLFFAIPLLKSCWLQEYNPPLFICQNSPPPSLYLLPFPTMLNCCDTVALERLVLKYSFLMKMNMWIDSSPWQVINIWHIGSGTDAAARTQFSLHCNGVIAKLSAWSINAFIHSIKSLFISDYQTSL